MLKKPSITYIKISIATSVLADIFFLPQCAVISKNVEVVADLAEVVDGNKNTLLIKDVYFASYSLFVVMFWAQLEINYAWLLPLENL